ncbi:hypothetical protein EUBDOL_01700 [Amedibacillus dolichus DSM 3991]|uniref:Uncharacterized protein n=1 Tax=Amedibacillus dolichus DSM 3991 TaxID=428127 RepID=A8RE61_9FIRM|nr:hypothetical protein EUBDOL_01700 [Amedibacillus dolichus DSM 3991]
MIESSTLEPMTVLLLLKGGAIGKTRKHNFKRNEIKKD